MLSLIELGLKRFFKKHPSATGSVGAEIDTPRAICRSDK